MKGEVTGDVTGNVTGNLKGDVIGDVTGNVTGNLKGNSSTTTKLFKEVEIGGAAFDGSTDINLPGANQPGNQDTTGNAQTSTSCLGNSLTATTLKMPRKIGGVLFDGSSDIDLPGVNIKGDQDTSGTADKANRLNNKLNIKTSDSNTYLVFDGSKEVNINIGQLIQSYFNNLKQLGLGENRYKLDDIEKDELYINEEIT